MSSIYDRFKSTPPQWEVKDEYIEFPKSKNSPRIRLEVTNEAGKKISKTFLNTIANELNENEEHSNAVKTRSGKFLLETSVGGRYQLKKAGDTKSFVTELKPTPLEWNANINGKYIEFKQAKGVAPIRIEVSNVKGERVVSSLPMIARTLNEQENDSKAVMELKGKLHVLETSKGEKYIIKKANDVTADAKLLHIIKEIEVAKRQLKSSASSHEHTDTEGSSKSPPISRENPPPLPPRKKKVE